MVVALLPSFQFLPGIEKLVAQLSVLVAIIRLVVYEILVPVLIRSCGFLRFLAHQGYVFALIDLHSQIPISSRLRAMSSIALARNSRGFRSSISRKLP